MNKPVIDIIDYNLDVLFVGVNPGLETARTGNHFAHPSNRFWNTLYTSGFTDRKLLPHEKHQLLDYNLGITNIIERPTKTEKELKTHEFLTGKKEIINKMQTYLPRFAAFVGIGMYKKAFKDTKARVGPQESIAKTKIWVLPQPSGLNAHYPPEKLTYEFRKLYEAVYS